MARLQESMGALGSARAAYEQCLLHGKETGFGGNEAALGLQALKRRLN